MKYSSCPSALPSSYFPQRSMTAFVLKRCSTFLLASLLGICTQSACATENPELSLSASPASATETDALPPLPAGVTDLDFHDFFKLPIGPLGLEPTAKLLSLDTRQVRITGFMVQEEEPHPGIFMLTAAPVRLAEVADGPADDLPASILFVHLPADAAADIQPYRPGRWMLTGTLQLGQKEEAGERVSYARLLLEPSATEPETSAALPVELPAMEHLSEKSE